MRGVDRDRRRKRQKDGKIKQRENEERGVEGIDERSREEAEEKD